MHTDSRGHTLTTNSSDAASSCALAMDHYMERKCDVVTHLDSALSADPECAIAHATMGLMLHGAKHGDLQPLVETSLKAAKAYASGVSPRESLYISALDNACKGLLDQSVLCFESILKDHPTDGFALSLAQAELFWLGDMKRSLVVSSSVSTHWNENITGYGDFLAMRAFDLEEAGQYEQAERAGREAVELNGANIWATHAVAHVLYMQGRHKEGVDWISSVQANWQGIGQMQFHVWWHKCLCHLERGENDAALEGYDNWVRNREHELVQARPDLYIDFQNGASLLWRLELHGANVGTRWNEMATLAKERIGDMGSPFTSAHYAVILSAVGDYDTCQKLIEAMQDFSTQNSQTLSTHYEKAAVPAALAAIAHRRGEYERVVELLYPARFDLGLMGGSHAQQDLFFQILLDAVSRTQALTQVDALLQEIEHIGFLEPQKLSAYNLIRSRCTRDI